MHGIVDLNRKYLYEIRMVNALEYFYLPPNFGDLAESIIGLVVRVVKDDTVGFQHWYMEWSLFELALGIGP